MESLFAIVMLVAILFSAGSLAKKVYTLLVSYGPVWAVLGSIATFMLSTVAFAWAAALAAYMTFGR